MTDNYELVGSIRSAIVCAREKCVVTNQHQTHCLCTAECPNHDGHCNGCLRSPAETGELCRRCLNTTRDALREIPELAAHAAARNDGKLSPVAKNTDDTRRGTQAHAPSLSPAWDTAEEVFQWAYLTARACADENRHAGPFRYRNDGVPARNLTQLVTYITAHLAWYAADIPREIYAEATGWKRALERLTGQDRLTHRIKTPCPSCNQRTLIREDGADRVQCKNRDCGRIWREGEFDWMAHVLVG